MKKISLHLGAASLLWALLFSGINAFAYDIRVDIDDLQDPIRRTGQVTYEIKTENSQPHDAHNAMMAFPIPAGTTFISFDDDGTGACAHYPAGGPRPNPDDIYPGQNIVSCNFGVLQPTSGNGQPRIVLVTVQDNDGDNTTIIEAEATVQAENDPAYPNEDDNNPGNEVEGQNTTVESGADITVALTGAPNPVTAGGEVAYTGTVSNQGPDDESSDITVVFQLSANETYQSKDHAGWDCTYDSGTSQLSCTRTIAEGGIPANTDAPPITFSTLVTGVSSGTTTTSGTVQPHTDDPNPNNNTASTDIQVLPGTDVAVEISAAPNTLLDGDTTTITLNPQNLGPIDANDVVVTYTVPDGFSLVNGTLSSTGWTCDETNLPTISCTRTDGNAYVVGTNDPITFDLTYPNWTGTPSYDHTVSISTTTSEAKDRLFNNEDTVTITTEEQAVDLALTKSKAPWPNVHPDNPAVPGQQLRSVLTVHNNGPLPFEFTAGRTLTVTDTLNTANETYSSYSGTDWDCSYTAPVVTCTYLATLPADDDAPPLYIYTTAIATPGSGGSIAATNNASVAYYDPDSTNPIDNNPDNNDASASVTITHDTVDLRIEHSVNPTTLQASEDELVYTIDVCNHNNGGNNVDATGVVMRQVIDGYYTTDDGYTTGITITSKPANYDCNIADNVVTCTQQSGTLALSDCVNSPTSDSFEIKVTRPLTAGEKTATATTYSTDLAEADRTNNSADAVTNVISAIDVEIQNKTVNPNPVKSGTEATYTLQVRNRGPEAAANVQVVDTFDFDAGDTGFTFISATPSGTGTCSGMTAGSTYNTTGAALTCTWSEIAGDAGETIEFTIRPNHWDGATYPGRKFENTATISTDSTDSNSNNNSFGPVILTIKDDVIDLIINNNDDPDPLGHDPNNPTTNDNNDVVYDLAFQNRGPSYASGVNTVFTMTPKNGKTVEFLCDDANADASATDCGTSANQCTVTSGSNPVTGSDTLELTCSHGDLAAGTDGHRYLRFRVHSAPAPGGDTHETTATISADQTDSNLANNQENENTTVRGLVDLVLSKTVSASPVNKTQAFEWTLEVTNTGPAKSRNTEVTDDLSGFDLYDEPITCANQTTPSSSCSCSVDANKLMTCSLGTLAVNDEVKIVVPVKVDTAGDHENCANATTDDVDRNSNNNTACATVTVNDVFHPSDYGDAPDANNAIATGNYQTQLNYGGARHYLDTAAANTPFLGSCVDADGAGTLQNVQATADDANAGGTVIGTCTAAGDEDGVQIPVLVAGKTQNITVTIGGAACRLSGWIDFNQNGDWTDSEEKVIDDAQYGIGTHTISISVPDTIVVGHSYARFRCATETGLTPTGAQSDVAEADRTHPDYALDGEVEDYKVALQPDFAETNVDYGDAADSTYPTLQVNDGASHILGVAGAPILGDCVDSEQNAHQSSDATGDDTTAAGTPGTTIGTCVDDDDEDGVSFSDLKAGENATLTIKVSGGACRLNGWIDFDRNGTWESDERVFNNLSLNTGTHNQTISLANSIAIGNTMARFRCSSAANTLGPIGAAPDGEVEDYQVELLGFISGQVRMDADDDGDLTDTDDPISGVTINLIDPDTGDVIATTTTDENGNYTFTGLSAGDYRIEEVDPPHHFSTNDTDHPDDAAKIDNKITVTLGDSGSSTGNDFIDTHAAELGNRVWFDANHNGIQDVGEPGISGVRVVLFKENTLGSWTIFTDGEGYYQFVDLRTGRYFVNFYQPSGYTVTQENQGGDDRIDSDSFSSNNPSNTPWLDVPAGSSNMTVDCGMYLTSGDEPAQISDFVWYDSDQDGIQDPGESGIAGVKVKLLDPSNSYAIIATTTTDGNGHYVFDGLNAGNYAVEFVAPGYTFSAQGQGGNPTVDSDADPATGRTADITLTAGQINSDIDAGLSVPGQQPASISNLVWYDSDKDGIQDAGEPGIGGVTVTLYAADNTNTPLSTVTTDTSGNYAFNGLLPGDYVVRFDLPTGYIFTSANTGGNTATDSDADQTTGMSDTITLAAGANNQDIDAGMYLESTDPVSIGDLVYLDSNFNGSYDAGEGYGGVDLYLYDLYGTLIGQTTTAADGSYSFTNLAPGDYVVKVDTADLPGNSFQIEDPDSVLDSTYTAMNVTTDIDTVDFGYSLTYIRGQVRFDDDNDGDLNDSDDPIGGVTIQLLDADNGNAVVGTATTDENGNYIFSDLPPGNYVVVETDPSGYLSTNDADSNNTATERDNQITVSLGTEGSSGNDFIDTLPASIGDRVWYDTNTNGIQDLHEVGIAGVTVNLYSSSDLTTALATVLTDGDGAYLFADLYPGYYVVEFVQPAVSGYTYTVTTQDAGSNDVIDSDATASSPHKTAIYPLGVDEYNSTVDCGMYLVPDARPARLADFVWYDSNQNGIQDDGEPGIAGVTVKLLDSSDNLLATDITDGNGNYAFNGLAAGEYVVQFELPTGYTMSAQHQGDDTTVDSDADVSTGKTAAITLLAGENNPNIDAGMFIVNQSPASLGDFVWYDANQDGIQDAGETGIGGVTVTLFDPSAPDTPVATTVTDGEGRYQFTGLLAGDYVVHFALPENYVYTLADAGGDDTKDSDANSETGLSATVSIASGGHYGDLDCGLYMEAVNTVSIGDTVYADANYDGDFDAGEGIANVTLSLYNELGVLQAVTTTDSDGNYQFSDLPEGSYYVEVDKTTLPVGVFQIEDPDGTMDSAYFAENVTSDIDTVDFGYTYINSVGDYVWLDENKNGIQDPSEPGITGVTVNLRDDTGTIVATTTTDGNGHYLFTELLPGNYQVECVLPAGYSYTLQDQGTGALADSYDSDIDPATGRTILFTLMEDEQNMTRDCGMYLNDNVEPASLGDFVWFDANQDGIQDGDETGISGVTVTLYDGSFTTQIATIHTDGDGKYSFTGLTAGEYGVEFTLPAGYTFTGQDQGTDDMLDSDADTTTGRTAAINLTAGEDNLSIDAGLYLTSGNNPASLGNFVWLDTNRNGIQETGEGGVVGVTVELYAADDLTAPLATDITDADGKYLFSGLPAGQYVVRFIAPEDYIFCVQGAGTETTDSDADVTTGYTAAVTLAEGDNRDDIDAGLHAHAEADEFYTIGDLVWLDRNHNGVFDPGEGLAGVELVLSYAQGGVIERTITNEDGIYSFNEVQAGNYRVAVDTSTLPLDTTPDPDAELIQIDDPDDTFDDTHHLIDFDADTDLVDFGYREREVDVELTKVFELITDNNNNGEINKGDILRFTVSLINKGPDEATGIIVYDELAEGYELVNTTLTQGSYNAPLWYVGSLPVNGTASLSMDVRVLPKTKYENTAEVIAGNEYDTDSTPGNGVEGEDDQATVKPDIQDFPWLMFIPTLPRCPHAPEYCYIVSDEDSTVTKSSALFRFDFGDNELKFLGRLGVKSVEGSALSLDGTTLYAVNNGRLGVIDTTPGNMSSFAPINSNRLGFARGKHGRLRIRDIDGMTFNPVTGELYACARRSDNYEGYDMLVKIDIKTGKLVPNAFGKGVEYLVLDTHELNNAHTDALAFTDDGVLYAVVENSGGGGGDTIVTIDTKTGRITPVTKFSIEGRPLEDVEGLTFYYRNTLFGTTGTEFTGHGYDNSLFRIDIRTGRAVRIKALDVPINGFTPYDFETISCPVCKP